ncbi:YhjD/YihY/BrkB family envelope integrity protein [Actinoplanes sp. NPDC049596]|uniref:YihY/virulence factor BrkB family protein n=1 Tax=unclassified Actinoplanes TaxID=2626549 RepID=UPI003418CAF6
MTTRPLPGAPRWVGAVWEWASTRWPGRIGLGTLAAIVRLEIFDRAMTLAAQLFTSVFPLLIMLAVLLGRTFDEKLATVVKLPDEVARLLNEAISGSSVGAFGVVGTLIVLVSTTSLARAFTRAYATIWGLPRPRSTPRHAWRWLVAVLVLAFSVVAIQLLVRAAMEAPAPYVTVALVTMLADLGGALFLPWILTARRIPARLLLPGALLFAVAMLVLRPAGSLYLPHALDVSAARFGTIGVAFTYIGWLYVLSFAYLITAAAGQVIATDPGRLGLLIRNYCFGRRPRTGSPPVPADHRD